MEAYPNGDGTISILVDAQDKNDALIVFSKFNIEVVETYDAIFNSKTGKVSNVDFTVRASEADVSFALASSTKMLTTRPYPPEFVHRRRGSQDKRKKMMR